jgi:hypothetical protein
MWMGTFSKDHIGSISQHIPMQHSLSSTEDLPMEFYILMCLNQFQGSGNDKQLVLTLFPDRELTEMMLDPPEFVGTLGIREEYKYIIMYVYIYIIFHHIYVYHILSYIYIL